MSIVCKDSSNQTIERLYQWDAEYDIYITGVDLSSIPLCHFCNRRSRIAYVVAPTADNGKLKVTIPNALLAEPETIFLYLYYNAAGGANRTVYVISFPVVPRQRPQNYAAVDNYLSVEMIDQAIIEYIQEAAEQITDGLVSRVEALELSNSDISDELADIREGYDGTEYQSAGDAVRAIGAAVAEIDPVPDVHQFASQQDYNDNVDPIYSGDFIVITRGSNGEKRLAFKQKDGTVVTLVTTDGFYRLPPTGIPLTDLSDEVQALIQSGGDSGDIVINDGHKTFGFVNETAYESFIEDYPSAIRVGDYFWINESTPVTKKYVLYTRDQSVEKSPVFTINDVFYITVSIENNELVSDTTLAQIRQALSQNRDLVLISETGVPIGLSYVIYSDSVVSEVQFTTTAFNGVCHILGTYIINDDGLSLKWQNLTMAGIKDIVVEPADGVDGAYEIVSTPDIFDSLTDITDAFTQGVDIGLLVHLPSHPNYPRVARHPLVTVHQTGLILEFGGYELQSANGEMHTVLAVYTVGRGDEYVTRTEYYIDNADVPSGGGTGGTKTTWSGTCSTDSSTAAKTVSLSGYTLETSSIVNITFTNAVNANATLNINSTGAKSIYYHGAAINSGVIGAGATALMFYDGTHYCLISTDYTYIKPSGGIPETDLANAVKTKLKNAGQGHGYATCSTAAATAAKTAALTDYELVAGGSVSVKFTYAVPANATLSVNSKTAKEIYYHGSAITANVIQAGDTATFRYDGTYYHLIAIDRQSSGSSSASAYFVHINWNGSVFTCTESYSDIYDAFDSNVPVAMILDGEALGWMGYIDNSSAVFYAVAQSSGGQSLYEFTLTSSNVLTLNEQALGTGNANNPTVSNITSTTPTIVAADNRIYSCGELTSLTITDSAQNIAFTVDFTSGATATTITVPSGYKAPGGDLTAEANKEYELDVRNGKAVLTAFEAVSA